MWDWCLFVSLTTSWAETFTHEPRVIWSNLQTYFGNHRDRISFSLLLIGGTHRDLNPGFVIRRRVYMSTCYHCAIKLPSRLIQINELDLFTCRDRWHSTVLDNFCNSNQHASHQMKSSPQDGQTSLPVCFEYANHTYVVDNHLWDFCVQMPILRTITFI